MGAFLFNMKKALILLLLVFPVVLFAQKQIEKTYDSQGIQTLYINSDTIFKITITAKAVDNITIYTIIDGETFESSLLHTKIVDDRLEIATGYTPDYIPFNDKLSAHKVLSIELEIVLPKHINIDIRSTLAAVNLQGVYDKLTINLGRGGFMGRDIRFRESVINTISGNVTATLKEANINAGSRNGQVKVDRIFNHGPSCIIQSIYGNIEVSQVK